MAKHISVTLDPSYLHESPRGPSISLGKALEYFVGDVENPKTMAEMISEAVCYAALRKIALGKDHTRHGAGEAPNYIYTPRVDVKGAPEKAKAIKAAAAERFAEMLGVTLAKPEPKSSKRSEKAAKLAENEKKIAALQAKIAAAKKAQAEAKPKTDEGKAKLAANKARMAELEAKISASKAAVKAKAPTVRKPVHASADLTPPRELSADELMAAAAHAESRGDRLTAERLMAKALSL